MANKIEWFKKPQKIRLEGKVANEIRNTQNFVKAGIKLGVGLAALGVGLATFKALQGDGNGN